MATGTMEDYGVPVQTTRLSLSSMKLLCFEMFPDVGCQVYLIKIQIDFCKWFTISISECLLLQPACE